MHAIELADLASVLAIHGPALLFRRDLLPEQALQAYWTACRQRCNEWHQGFGEYRRAEVAHDHRRMLRWWTHQEALADEVLLAEPLTRILAAFGAILDHGHLTEEISPVTHSVYANHFEARNRVLRLMVCTSSGARTAAARLNKLRALAEQWADALLGHLWTQCGAAVEPYAHDANRVRAFGQEINQLPRGRARDAAGWLMTAAMRESLMRHLDIRAVSPECNRRVADAALMCLRPDLFDAVGSLKSLWLHRLERGSEQTDRVIGQLAMADISACDMLGGFEAVRARNFGRW